MSEEGKHTGKAWLRLREFISSNLDGGCKVLSLGEDCLCGLCDLDHIHGEMERDQEKKKEQLEELKALRKKQRRIRTEASLPKKKEPDYALPEVRLGKMRDEKILLMKTNKLLRDRLADMEKDCGVWKENEATTAGILKELTGLCYRVIIDVTFKPTLKEGDSSIEAVRTWLRTNFPLSLT